MAGNTMLSPLLMFLILLFPSTFEATYDLPYKIPGPRRLNDKIGIVGAGPSGVHMALLLKNKGFKNVEILEKTSRIGGKSQSINYRGAVHEMGTVYLSSDYTSIHELVKTYLPPNNMVPFPSASIWLDNMPVPVGFREYIANYTINEIILKNKIKTKSKKAPFEKTGIKKLIMEVVLRAIMFYENLHELIFGNYDGEIMPEPNTKTMFTIRGTFMDFIERHKELKALVPIFQLSMTVQGYGHLDEISALYGLMWNTPKFINGFKERMLDPNTGGMTILRSGFQTLWENIVKEENMKVTFNVDIYKVYRPVSRRYTLEGKLVESKCTTTWVCKRARGKNWNMPYWERYDFLIWSPEMRSTMHVWKDPTDVERRLFLPTTSTYFTTAILDSKNMPRGESPIDYWMDNVLKKREQSVWAQRNSYGVINQQIGKSYLQGEVLSRNDENSKPTTVTYQMSAQKTEQKELERKLLEHFSGIYNATGLYIQNMSTWSYFPRYSPVDMGRGILWRILENQGKFNMWYIGSSVCFESVKSVVEYNKLLVKNMEPPK